MSRAAAVHQEARAQVFLPRGLRRDLRVGERGWRRRALRRRSVQSQDSGRSLPRLWWTSSPARRPAAPWSRGCGVGRVGLFVFRRPWSAPVRFLDFGSNCQAAKLALPESVGSAAYDGDVSEIVTVLPSVTVRRASAVSSSSRRALVHGGHGVSRCLSPARVGKEVARVEENPPIRGAHNEPHACFERPVPDDVAWDCDAE